MMINNVVLSSLQREHTNTKESKHSKRSSLTGSLGSQRYLADVKSVIGSESSESNTYSSKLIESLDVKTTKSILLRQIVEKCKLISCFDSLYEGALIKLDGIQLKILNEENLRQILMLRKDALKGFRVEGMEINNLISSILQDYSYILFGHLPKGDDIVIKIPSEIQNEFESKYNVDDLLIGHVSVIGVYKGNVNESSITSNTFKYLTSYGNQQIEPEKKVFPSSIQAVQQVVPCQMEQKNYHFVDVIAIIQDVSFQQENLQIVTKLPCYKQICNWIKGRIKK